MFVLRNFTSLSGLKNTMVGLYKNNVKNAKIKKYQSNKIVLFKKTRTIDDCKELVRKYDYYNYFTSFFFPTVKQRQSHIALSAFNVEIAQIADSTNKIDNALLRYQFWKEVIDNIYSGKDLGAYRLPITHELEKAIKNHELSKQFLKNMINEREKDVKNGGIIRTMSDLETFGSNTIGNLLRLKLEVLGIKDVEADHVASHIGTSMSLVTMIRSLPFLLQKRICRIPTELMVQHNVSTENIIRGTNQEVIEDIVFEIAKVARAHLVHGKQLHEEIPKDSHKALLCSSVPFDYLVQLEKANFNIFDGKANKQRRLFIQYDMLKNYFTKKY
eukprot:TRINITY_DN559_c4_g1_i1.p1 TRINITY_DN559_c4_g1~~TRINITY_DN559_c4_g1_i1.p1  ORF type:complete len:329 (-),score=55.90 TRINITY_DN559_c4_g1_i1:187-1173(-)